MKLVVELNGTDKNPYHLYGLTQNPIPQIAKRDLVGHCLTLQSLGGDPIPHDTAEEYIRKKLRGWSKEFVDLCVQQFVPGKYVKFAVSFQ